MLKKLLVLLLCLCFFVPVCAEENAWQPIPEVLRFSYTIGEREALTYKTYLRRSYPKTVLTQENEDILDRLEERNILCVTVEELLIHYGVTPEGDKAYFGFENQPVPPIEEGSDTQ